MAEPIGQQLRQAREARALSLDQVAGALRIRQGYLRALEAGAFDQLPSRVQARGFLRLYADYLKLDPAALLAELDGETGDEAETGAAPAAPVEATAPSGSMPVSTEAAPGPAESQEDGTAAIFAQVGLALRQRRELLGLALEDVERHTHLRLRYLQAMEAGDMNGLPSPVQGRGMLKNYAAFLGLDPDPLLLQFAEGLQARLALRKNADLTQPRRASRRSLRLPIVLRRIFSAEAILVTLTVVFLIGFVFWAAVRIFAMRAEQQPSPTAPSIAEVLLATPGVALSPTPATATPSPEAAVVVEQQTPQVTGTGTSLPEAGEGVRVYVTVRQRTWLRVLVDGEVAFEGRVLPGTAYQYEGDERVELLTGNGAALQVFFNQQDIGTLGLFGQVVEQIFTGDGMQTPTPTITLTPTATSRPTRTPPGTPATAP